MTIWRAVIGGESVSKTSTMSVEGAFRPGAAGAQGSAARGIVTVLVAWLMLACMDAGSKLLAEDYPIVQILWVRFVLLAAFAFWFTRRSAGIAGLRTRHLALQTARAVLLTVEIGLFIYAITVLPLASAHAIFAITPLLITALAVPLLGERVGARRWAAVGVAFLGVLVILRPDQGVIHPMSLIVLICAVMFALYQILTRMVSRNDPPPVTLFYTAALGAAGLTIIGPFFWVWPDAAGWALLLLVAFLGGGAHFLLIKALQQVPASVLQPFGYTIMLWATVVGFLVFGNLPDLWTIAGGTIIAASGVYAFARERLRSPPGPT